MKFIRSGIHTRLENIIQHSGGMDRACRIKYLQKKYNLTYREASVLIHEEIEKMTFVDTHTLKQLAKIKEKEIEQSSLKFNTVFATLGEMSRKSRNGWFR